MKNIGMKVLCGALLCGAFLGANNANAYNYLRYEFTIKINSIIYS